LQDTGNPNNIIILGAGSENSLEQSAIAANVPQVIGSSINIIEKRGDVSSISPEVYMASMISVGEDKHLAVLRGITPTAFTVHWQVTVNNGTYPASGEVLVGRLAHIKLGVSKELLSVGNTLEIEGRKWRISGEFVAPGTALEAELWLPLSELMTQIKRDTLSCAVVTLKPNSDVGELELFTKTRIDLAISAIYETEYYKELTKYYQPVRILGWMMATLIAIGGGLGGLNTMYGAIQTRAKELATLETLGFSRIKILISILQEFLLLTVTGTLVASLFAIFIIDGMAIRFTMGAFTLRVDGVVLTVGLIVGMLLGVLGVLLPAYQLLRRPLIEALRS
jgi:ABC-type antimicrobial peptide transport system permease subunit